MRTPTFVRAGAVITASALALSLGVGPVAAAETDSATARGAAAAPDTLGSASFTPAPAFDAAGTITALRLGSGVITERATTQFVGNVAGSSPGGSVQTDVRVNGTLKGRVELYPGQGNGGVEVPRQWGSGTVQIGPTYFSDGSVDPNLSNIFYARKLVTSTRSDNYPLRINRRNNAMTFRAFQVVIVNPATGRFQSVKRVKLQQLKGSTWKTIKTIKLNSKGSGSYKTSIKKKYRYRLYLPATATQTKFETIKTGKI